MPAVVDTKSVLLRAVPARLHSAARLTAIRQAMTLEKLFYLALKEYLDKHALPQDLRQGLRN